LSYFLPAWSLADITLASRCNVLSGASDNMYMSEFRNALLADTQLCALVTSAVLEKSFKYPIAWQVVYRARPLHQLLLSWHYTRAVTASTITSTSAKGSRPTLYRQHPKQTYSRPLPPFDVRPQLKLSHPIFQIIISKTYQLVVD